MKKQTEAIIFNIIQCRKCKDIIISKTRHDYFSCSCGAVAVDGGRSYLRRLGEPKDYIELSIITDESGTVVNLNQESLWCYIIRAIKGIFHV